MSDISSLKRRVDAAQGRIPCDFIIEDVSYLDMFQGQWIKGDIAWIDGVIVGVESGLKATRVFSGKGKFLVPGFIDAHVHVESSMMIPSHFEKAVLVKGTTSAICDPHELANVQGVSGIKYFLDQSEILNMDLHIMLPSCVPATHLETNGGGTIGTSDLSPFALNSRALGLAEMMNIPGVIHGDSRTLSKLESFCDFPRDGHAPLLRGRALSAYASTGISSCHESSQLEEASEKLTKGMAVWIREGSVAKDLEALTPLLNWKTSSSVGFCTDDRNPLDIKEEGHIDHLIRQSIRKGIPSEIAYRASSWSVARHYGLSLGARKWGAIAPGYQADLVLLNDANSVAIEKVFKIGRPIDEFESLKGHISISASIHATKPAARDLEGPEGRVNVIGVDSGKIITRHEVLDSTSEGVMRLSVLERYGHGSKPSNGYATGFGNLKGAIASSVGHDSHNLCVVGGSSEDMATALGALIHSGGGFCVVSGGKVLEHLELRLGGLMSAEEPDFIVKKLVNLKKASREIGCVLPEPFLQLAFLCLPVIPKLKLTDKGLVDVDRFELIPVRA